jgi:hypothetical protein
MADVKARSWLIYPWEREPIPMILEARWVPGSVWTGAKNLAFTWIWSRKGPTHSDSPYWLHYPCPLNENWNFLCASHKGLLGGTDIVLAFYNLGTRWIIGQLHDGTAFTRWGVFGTHHTGGCMGPRERVLMLWRREKFIVPSVDGIVIPRTLSHSLVTVPATVDCRL